QGPAGRHPRRGHAARREQGHARLPQVPSAHPDPARRPRRRPTGSRLQSLRIDPGGGQVSLRDRYQSEAVPALTKQFAYGNPMQVPRLSKIIVNVGLGEALTNAKAIDATVGDLAAITGQRPIVTRAKRSIAQFRVRTGNPIGVKVTLRG